MDIAWRKAFMEIALRAFRKLHIEYGAWGIGQSSINTPDWKNLNVGHGVELALETAVCAAISQEFINSAFTNGSFVEGNDRIARRWEIEREVKINGKTVDLFLNRYKKENNECEFYKNPVIIEAKRAHYFTPDISTGKRGKLKKNVDRLKRDLNKLKAIRNKIEAKKYKILLSGYKKQRNENKLRGVFIYLLFWGISEKKENQNWGKEPFQLAEEIQNDLIKIKDNKSNYELRWMPLKWEYLNKDDGSSYPEVYEWLWIMLVEIEPRKENPSKDKDSDWFKKNNK